MTPENAPAIEPPSAGLSEISRLTGVFFEPGKTFADIAARPRWLVPMLVVILIGIAATFEISQRVGWERVVSHSMETSSRAQNMTAEQRAQAIQTGVKIASVTAYLGPVLGVPISWLVISGVLLGVFAGILSAPVKFKQAFAVVAYSSLPGAIFWILVIVVLQLKNPDDFNVQNPLAFNPGAFMDPMSSSKVLYSLASSLELFTLWTIILMAVGFKAAAGKKLSSSAAFLAVFLPWCIWVGAKAVLAGIFS